MKIAVFGGSFSPPHLGHADVVKAAQRALEPDLFLIIPAAEPPHKQLDPSGPDSEKRLRLTRLAFAGVDGVEVSDIELARGGVSYTSDTVDELIALYPGAELTLIIGTDMLLSFESWYEFRHILGRVRIAVYARQRGDDEKNRDIARRLQDTYGAEVLVLPKIPLPMTSTDIRELLRHGKGRNLLDDEVYEEIIRGRLYGALPDFEWLREKAYAYLKPSRIAHVAGCEQEAVRLAERWGADARDAAEAAILHDITKKLLLNEQLILCENYAIVNDSLEKCSLKLLHARTGAAIAKRIFGSSDEVCSAILWHTTARPDMTLLEKIIYIADYIEPNRDFDGVDRLRFLAYQDLDSAMLLGLKMSVEELVEKGMPIHPKTLAALAWFTGRKGNDQ